MSVSCEGWCGYCYENAKGRANHKSHRGYRPPKPLPAMGLEMAIRKRDIALGEGTAPAKLNLGVWGKTYPTLWEFLSLDKYDDGSPRRLPTITIFLGPDGLQACLNDRDQSLAAFVTSVSLEGLWQALEKGLKEDSLDWRRSSNFNGKKSKK